MIILVHTEIWGVNTSPPIRIGNPCTNTVALSGLSPVRGIKGVGGHQHVKFLIRMV
jgi:hypothetical protein